MVVEAVVVNGVPTAVEIIREVDERVAAVQQGGLVFELLHPDACRREAGRGCYLLWGEGRGSGNHRMGGCREEDKKRDVGVRCPVWVLVQLEESQTPNPRSHSLPWIPICLECRHHRVSFAPPGKLCPPPHPTLDC